jgi:hypothetical protein
LITSTKGKLLTVSLFSITEGMSQNVAALKRKKWVIVSRDHSNITAMCWKGKKGKYITLICS